MTTEEFKAIEIAHERICNDVLSYVRTAQDIDLSIEGDWDSFEDSVLENLLLMKEK